MTEPIMNVFEVLDKLDFFNQRAGRELWSEKPIDVQNKDIENFSNDVAFLKEYITSQNAELLQYAKDQHGLMIEKDELFDIAEKQKAEIEFLIRMKASDFETSYTAVKARLADEMNRAEMDRRKDTEIRQLRIKLDDCERDIIPKLKYSLERANKYGAETDAENIQLLKENEELKANIERLKGNAPKIFISDKTPSRYFKVKSSQPILIYPYEETKIELVPSKEQIKAEAIKDIAEKTHEMITEIYNKHIFGNNDLEAEEKDAIINFSDDITYGFDNLVKETIGEQE